MYEIIREARIKKNISLQQMAKAIGLKTASAYSKKEKAKVPITIEEFRIISTILDISFEKIL